MLTRNDDGHQTGVSQEQIGAVHELHVVEHLSRVVAHSAVYVADYEGYGEVDGDPQQRVGLKTFQTTHNYCVLLTIKTRSCNVVSRVSDVLYTRF
jgi:hypothetical protein